MTATVNDTRSKQIDRGELFFNTLAAFIKPSSFLDILVTTSTPVTSLLVEATTISDGAIELYDSPTGAAATGSVLPSVNMNFSSANTIAVTVEWQVMPSTTGTIIINEPIYRGEARLTSPLATEQGVILDASTDYLLRVKNLGPNDAPFSIALFMREI